MVALLGAKMGKPERLKLYEQIESLRQRPLVTYVTNPRPGLTALMASDAIPELLDQLSKLPSEATAVDLMVVSNGGDPTVAWRFMSLLRERVKQVGVLVPQAAFSAATLLALGADEIVMHPHGNLGPVDPQISVRRKRKEAELEEVRFGFEELAGFLDFARKDVGLTDQAQLREVFSNFCQEVGSVPVGVAARGARLSLSLGEKLLKMHMRDADAQKARGIAEALNKNFFHHGYALSRSEAREIGLKVGPANPTLEALMWDVWKDLEVEMKVRAPFNPAAELAASQAATMLFGPVPQVALPTNLPPQLLQQAYQAILAQLPVQQVPPADFEAIGAVMESVRLGSRSVARGKILASRLPDMQLAMNVVHTFQGWESF